MNKLIVNVVVGLTLFGGALAGGLAVTGRLNHEGVANIPLLNALFPAPPEGEAGTDEAGPPGASEGAQPAPMGEVSNSTSGGGRGVPADAGFSLDGQEPDGTRRLVKGRSIDDPESTAAEGGHGAAGGDAPGGHAGDPGEHDGAAAAGHVFDQEQAPSRTEQHDLERDFTARELALARDRTNEYAPGGYFTFQGMPSGMTAEQLNAAWGRVQNELTDLEKRHIALDLRDKELRLREDDISRRQLELGKLREQIADQHRLLDERIEKFQEQVKLVRSDEVAGLRRNAKTYEALPPERVAELVKALWETEDGQTQVLKIFEFMKPDKVDEVINELANPLIQDVLKKRLLISKEATPSEGRRK